MNSSVIVFPAQVIEILLRRLLNSIQDKMVWHKDNQLPKSDLIVIPGGFSYGITRSGAIAAKSNILKRL